MSEGIFKCVAMRWPLRYQIMLPMAAVMLLAVLFVEGVGVLLAVRDAKQQIDRQIREIERIAAAANFPFTDAVLRQMKALSGAELAVVDESGKVAATSIPIDDTETLSRSITPNPELEISRSERILMDGRVYFHAVVPLSAPASERGLLHILYPEDAYQEAWQREVFPSLGFIGIALPVVLLLAYATASRIASRIGRLHDQVDRIAQGDFHQFTPPEGDDEIHALAESVNRMASMLAQYEEEVRRTERMRTLALLGGGIAHQLRNSATGCAMAVDFHAEECPLGATSESLAVAKRQLRLMEEFIQRFLQLGKPPGATPHEPLDLVEVVEEQLPLIHPAAKHAGVELQWEHDEGIRGVPGRRDQLGQVVINLLLNAIEAASHDPAVPALVRLTLQQPSADHVMLCVSDSGAGPTTDVSDSLFDPFVSEKPDGVGLGLSVVREIVAHHGGTIEWYRKNDRTHFVIELPTETNRANRVEPASCR